MTLVHRRKTFFNVFVFLNSLTSRHVERMCVPIVRREPHRRLRRPQVSQRVLCVTLESFRTFRVSTSVKTALLDITNPVLAASVVCRVGRGRILWPVPHIAPRVPLDPCRRLLQPLRPPCALRARWGRGRREMPLPAISVALARIGATREPFSSTFWTCSTSFLILLPSACDSPFTMDRPSCRNSRPLATSIP